MILTGKKIRLFSISVAWTILLTACRPATPLPPISSATVTEFTLTPGQIVTITDTELTIKLIDVAGDERCPSEIECASSGPVSISLEVKMGNADSTSINLQTFTDNNGRAPDTQFEGIEDRVMYEGYLIRVVGVLPYPSNLTSTIRDSEYRVTLVVSKE
jgi:hypothetical protein